MVPSDEDDLLDRPNTSEPEARRRGRAASPPVDFAEMVLENLRTTGVHQSQKADSIRFISLVPWPGTYIGAEGRYTEGDNGRRRGTPGRHPDRPRVRHPVAHRPRYRRPGGIGGAIRRANSLRLSTSTPMRRN